ncbi:MAG TPA: hypothetical protein VFF39_13855 [Verrucomicrobiae bacterium]|nr:hypothetical protein [Verrucomicrobiae bacterium]
MKAMLTLIVALAYSGAFASDPPVWNRPTHDISVGTAAYLDCQTPSTFTGTGADMQSQRIEL